MLYTWIFVLVTKVVAEDRFSDGYIEIFWSFITEACTGKLQESFLLIMVGWVSPEVLCVSVKQRSCLNSVVAEDELQYLTPNLTPPELETGVSN